MDTPCSPHTVLCTGRHALRTGASFLPGVPGVVWAVCQPAVRGHTFFTARWPRDIDWQPTVSMAKTSRWQNNLIKKNLLARFILYSLRFFFFCFTTSATTTLVGLSLVTRQEMISTKVFAPAPRFRCSPRAKAFRAPGMGTVHSAQCTTLTLTGTSTQPAVPTSIM